MKSRTRSIPAALALSLAAALGACSEPVSTAAKPCPCAEGYVCCESGVCAADQASCGVATAALSVEAQGHWTGYVENSNIKLVSDSLDIQLSVDAEGTLTGQVRFGDGPPPPPPTTARQSWPPAGHVAGGNGPTFPLSFLPINGATYTALNVRWQARRLRFDVRLTEPVKAWCELQTSRPYTNGYFTCSPATSSRPSRTDCLAGDVEGGDATEPVPCDWLDLCEGGQCACTATGCTNNTDQFTTIAFDVTIRGDEADGSMEESNIRLVRAGQ